MKKIKLLFLIVLSVHISYSQTLLMISPSDSTLAAKDISELKKNIAPIKKEMEPLYLKYKEESLKYNCAKKSKESSNILDSMKVQLAILHDKLTPYQEKIKQNLILYIDKHPDSYASAWALISITSTIPFDTLMCYYSKLSPKIQQSSYGVYINKQIVKFDNVSVGRMAPDFSSTDINGVKLKLSDFKGSYILLDFWASWCIPCRKGNSHLIELYKKYHSSGIEFLSIASDDDHHDDWKRAIRNDGIGEWRHILRGYKKVQKQEIGKNEDSLRNNDLFSKYGLSVIPTKILIDPQGQIIGKYIGDNDKKFDEKLKIIFDR